MCCHCLKCAPAFQPSNNWQRLTLLYFSKRSKVTANSFPWYVPSYHHDLYGAQQTGWHIALELWLGRKLQGFLQDMEPAFILLQSSLGKTDEQSCFWSEKNVGRTPTSHYYSWNFEDGRKVRCVLPLSQMIQQLAATNIASVVQVKQGCFHLAVISSPWYLQTTIRRFGNVPESIGRWEYEGLQKSTT